MNANANILSPEATETHTAPTTVANVAPALTGYAPVAPAYTLPFAMEFTLKLDKVKTGFVSRYFTDHPGFLAVAGNYLYQNVESLSIRLIKPVGINAELYFGLVAENDVYLTADDPPDVDQDRSILALERSGYTVYQPIVSNNTLTESYDLSPSWPIGLSTSVLPAIAPLQRPKIAFGIRSLTELQVTIRGRITGKARVSGQGYIVLG
uniref:Coat protein n=1 Tax=Deltaflexiviridae sp. TaxID=2809074 RepID=A0A9E9C115_9VIRU|nr:MAG: hypothetical protein [Deltaflexiviridae sp.]